MADLNGKWKVLTKTPVSENEAIWDLKVEGGALSGTLTSGSNEGAPLVDTKLDGNEFGFTVTITMPMGTLPFTMTGTYNPETDTISGVSKMAMGKSKFKGVRA